MSPHSTSLCSNTRQATASADERLRSLGAAKIELSDVIDAIRSVEGYEHFLDRPAFADVATAAATAPIVYFCASVHGGLALIVPPGRAEGVVPVWLPGCSRAALRDQIGTYFQAYAQRSSAASSWQAALDRLTQWLWDAVMAPVLAALPATRAVLVPTGLLGLLPLHAAWTNDPHTSTGRRYALDEALLTYTPNARTLTAARRLADQIPIERVLVVEEPRPVDASPLPHVLDEARAALAAFPTTRHLRHERATHNAVWGALNDHQVIHFACHGYANPAEPLASALLMAENQQLTLRHLLGSRLAARLVVLSACETALVGRALPNEVIGLPGGLLQAGAAGVIGSLWSVRDDSTMLLMTAFYQRWRFGGLEPAEALRQAQQWLRDHPKTDGKRADDAEVRHGHMHPYRWAAFAYVGA